VTQEFVEIEVGIEEFRGFEKRFESGLAQATGDLGWRGHSIYYAVSSDIWALKPPFRLTTVVARKLNVFFCGFE
jgi:hypothetical protein